MENKINIGSDIKLTVCLNTKQLDPLNIHSVQAYLVNMSAKSSFLNLIDAAYNEYDLAARNKADKIQFISRFPIEPMCDGYASSMYDICQCGHPHYHAIPCNCKRIYSGFGVYPHTFDGFKNHLWAHYDLAPLVDKIKRAEDLYNKNEQFFSYLATVEETSDANRFFVYFPGDEQSIGEYKLIIIAKVYQPGYSKFTKLKTVTMDYDKVFEVVETGGNDDLTITIGTTSTQSAMDDEGSAQDRYVVKGEYDGEGRINLKLSDGSYIPEGPINILSETEWYDDSDRS